ncbi:hypothetical protein [Enterovibrio sp. 27052020O]|uniref:hypothetical protein n=1 Tax=Enterovibrio sp. 27052020O TaxID=3241166 RepID=UPI00388DFEF6
MLTLKGSPFLILAFLASFGVSYYILSYGHIHEDAYILFIYAENLANGHGISYYQGGSNAEGATDFLWMILLSLFNMLGFDTAIAAGILNSLGIAVTTAVLMSFFTKEYRFLFVVPLSLVLWTSDVTAASIAGFSTGFYTSLVAIIFWIIANNNKQTIYFLPLVSIVMGLIRPDGVIIGVVATIVGLFLVRENGQKIERYLKFVVLAAAIGISYFIWRYSYFGLLLPLPLYVKNTSSALLPGLASHKDWFGQNYILIFSALSLLAFSKYRKILLLASIPVLTLFFILTFVTLSQNISHRFQAPVVVLCILIISFQLSKLRLENKHLVASFLLVSALVVYDNVMALKLDIQDLLAKVYINYLPNNLKDDVKSETVITLSEAGRFAYWVGGKKIDLVGLNTPEAALDGASVDLMERASPDVIFIHTAGTVILEDLCDSNFCFTSIDDIKERVIYENDWREVSDRVVRVPYVVFEYLDKYEHDYDILMVSYYGKYRHIYAIKKQGDIDVDSFVSALEKSFIDEYHLPYLSIKKTH